MIHAFDIAAAVPTNEHTERFFTLRLIERQAGKALAEAKASVGEELIQIRMDLGSDEEAWPRWLEEQARRSVEIGLEPLTDRTARNYMALARFRTTAGKRFPDLMSMSVACLYPVVTLADRDLADLAENGVPLQDGSRRPLSEATARDLKRAASAIRAASKPPATPVDPFEKAMEAVKALGPLTDAQRAQLAEVLGITCEPPKPEESATPPENVFRLRAEGGASARQVRPATPPPVPAPAPATPTVDGVVQQALPGVLRSINQLGALTRIGS